MQGFQHSNALNTESRPSEEGLDPNIIDADLLRTSLDHYMSSLQDHQEAFLRWLEELSKRPSEVDRFQFKKIR